MNTIRTTASTSTILAIDLGKYKSVACIHEEDGGEIRFTTFDTTSSELRRLIDQETPAVVIIEVCLLAGWVHDLCGELGVRCMVRTRPARPGSSSISSARRTGTTPCD